MNLNNYGGRRFLMTMGCGVVSTWLLWFGKISGNEYVTLITLSTLENITFMFLATATGNYLVDKASARKADKNDSSN